MAARLAAQHPTLAIDGARYRIPGGWGLVRASNTQPVLVLRFEAESEERLEAAQGAVDTVAAVFDGWGPKVHKRIRSGSAANEIIKAAKQHDAGLVVVAAGGRGLSDSVLVGSTAQRVQHYAPCPVLVVRPAPRRKK